MHLYRSTTAYLYSLSIRTFHARNGPLSRYKPRFELAPRRDFCTCLYINLYMHAYTHIYIYIHIFLYIYIYIHTYIYVFI